MRANTLLLGKAWATYDKLATNLRAEFHPEPTNMESWFRLITARFNDKPASKWIGDCYLLAFASTSHSTFDRALAELATRQACPVAIPS